MHFVLVLYCMVKLTSRSIQNNSAVFCKLKKIILTVIPISLYGQTLNKIDKEVLICKYIINFHFKFENGFNINFYDMIDW